MNTQICFCCSIISDIDRLQTCYVWIAQSLVLKSHTVRSIEFLNHFLSLALVAIIDRQIKWTTIIYSLSLFCFILWKRRNTSSWLRANQYQYTIRTMVNIHSHFFKLTHNFHFMVKHHKWNFAKYYWLITLPILMSNKVNL